MGLQKALPVHVLKKLNDADWESIYLKLIAHARCLAQSRYWRSGNKLDLANGCTAEDLVNEAIARVYEGRRNWDPEKNPDLFDFLKESVLSSMFNELATSADNTKTESFKKSDEQPGEQLEPIDLASPNDPHAQHLVRLNPNPEEILISAEQNIREKAILNDLLAATQNDPEATVILECAMDGVTAPRHISEQSGIPILKINNAQKRLRRLMEKFGSAS